MPPRRQVYWSGNRVGQLHLMDYSVKRVAFGVSEILTTRTSLEDGHLLYPSKDWVTTLNLP